jgi:tRNA threonylcarbamoyl adenosine modification protein YjeE
MNHAPAPPESFPDLTTALSLQGWTRHAAYRADTPMASGDWLTQWLAGLPPYGLIGLVGNLGAGKTTLMQHVAKHLGVAGPVTSPTFSLTHPLQNDAGQTLALHADLYRCRSLQEAQHLVFQQWLEDLDALPPTRHGGPWFFIEWPEILGEDAVAESFSGVMVVTPQADEARDYTYWVPGGEALTP